MDHSTTDLWINIKLNKQYFFSLIVTIISSYMFRQNSDGIYGPKIAP